MLSDVDNFGYILKEMERQDEFAERIAIEKHQKRLENKVCKECEYLLKCTTDFHFYGGHPLIYVCKSKMKEKLRLSQPWGK